MVMTKNEGTIFVRGSKTGSTSMKEICHETSKWRGYHDDCILITAGIEGCQADSLQQLQFNQNKRLSIWQFCCHWWHRKLLEWQLTVPPVTPKLSNWRPLFFRVMMRQSQWRPFHFSEKCHCRVSISSQWFLSSRDHKKPSQHQHD